MPAIKDTLRSVDPYIEDGTFSTANDSSRAAPHAEDLQPGLNAMMRCPLPPVSVSPDSLRQYYRGGQLPQTRVMSPPPNIINGALTGGGSGNITANSSSSTVVGLKVQQASITTPSLNSGSKFSGIINLGKVFQLVEISSNGVCEVRLYGTLNALQLDSYRSLDIAPSFGTEQGLIVDVALDQPPFTFPLEGICGSNYDNPSNPLGYISIINIGLATQVFTVTFSYVSLVN